jgi:hypothetical protein
MRKTKTPKPVRSSERVKCPVCGEKMQEPLTAKTCDRKGGPTKWEKLWLCQKDGFLLNGKVSKYPFREDT